MASTLFRYLLLPDEVSDFERRYLRRVLRVSLVLLLAHVPLLVGVAALCGTSPLLALVLSAGALAGPLLAYTRLPNPRHVARVFGVAAMFMGGLLVHFGQGPMQIEMHFYFFVVIALLAVFADPMVVVLAAVTVAAHHVLVYLLFPRSVFNYDASIVAVGVHALFVVVESAAACFVARTFFDNVIALERVIEQRTQQLARRNDEMRTILDSVEQGIVAVTADGRMSGARSAALVSLLGEPSADERLPDYLRRSDGNLAAWMDLVMASLAEGLPPSIALSQLPSRFDRDGRPMSIELRPLGGDDGFLVVVTDVTRQVAVERALADQAELSALFDKAIHDRGSLASFAAELDRLRSVVAESDDLVAVRRALHTIKGTCSIMGLVRTASAIHAVESVIEAENVFDESLRARAIAAIDTPSAKLAAVLDARSASEVDVDRQTVLDVAADLRRGVAPEAIADLMEDWLLQPVRHRLDELAAHVAHVAEQDGKQVTIDVDDGGLRAPEPLLRSFWSASAHVARNSAAHGIEVADERLAAGKPAHGTVRIRCRRSPGGLVFELSDDGRGLDVAKIAARTAAIGLGEMTPSEAIFADGVSTADQVDDVAGRGVGLSAWRAEVEALGGTVEVRSEPGMGATFVAFVPLAPERRSAARVRAARKVDVG